MSKNFIKSLVVGVVIFVIYALVVGYLCLPAWNIKSVGMAAFLLVGFILSTIASGLITISDYDEMKPHQIVALVGPVIIVILILIIGTISSAKIFSARKYAEIANIETCEFSDVISASEEVSDIALMDTETARHFGERTLGELSDLVSTYDVAEDYSTINLHGKPMKVAPLEYDSFFKYMKNKESGIPGYVLVDPVNNTAKYVKSEKPINYSPSASFGKNLYRRLRNYDLTAIYGTVFFELDEEENMYWIAPVYNPSIGLYGGKVVDRVVIMDANTGECKTYKMSDVPSWVDLVMDGDTICQYYNWYGKLRNGYWNSLFSQTGCFETTDDFGYKTIGDDVYIYTGVTSCNNSQSATGFVLANSKTGEMSFMSVTGAEENSAMAAAEGEVSDYGWKASFPSIINVNGEPVYLMVLKDDNNIVKRYAMVNIKSYNIVAIDATQKKVLAKYNALISGEDIDNEAVSEVVEVEIPEDAVTKTITIKSIDFIVSGGETTVYVKSTDGKIYRSQFDEKWIIYEPQSTVKVTVDADSNQDIVTIYEVQ
jgi:hypothetical protein